MQSCSAAMGGKAPKAADVGGLVDGDGAECVLLGAVHGHFHGHFRQDDALHALRVNDDRCGRFAHDFEGADRLHGALAHCGYVAGQADDAVGVMSDEIGVDEVVGNVLSLVGGKAGCGEDGGAVFSQAVVGNGWHWRRFLCWLYWLGYMGRICVAAAHGACIAGRVFLEKPAGLVGFVKKYTLRSRKIQAATTRGSSSSDSSSQWTSNGLRAVLAEA